MEVQVAVLADSANIAAGEKLNVLGVFDTIWAASFPTVHPFMVLALRFRLDYDDGEKAHDLTIALRDEDGREYFRASTKLNVKKIPPGAFQNVNQVLNFAGLGFGRPGKYTFRVTWDGEEKARPDLVIIQGKPDVPDPPGRS
jgi:hypothetical protein